MSIWINGVSQDGGGGGNGTTYTAGTSISLAGDAISVTQNVSTGGSPVFANVTASNNATVNGTFIANATIGHAPINDQTGTSYTLVLADRGKFITMNNASLSNLTLPNGTAVAFPIGTEGGIMQKGAGAVNIIAGGGVTLLLPPGRSATLSGQNATAAWKLVAANNYSIWGDLA